MYNSKIYATLIETLTDGHWTASDWLCTTGSASRAKNNRKYVESFWQTDRQTDRMATT